MDTYTRYFYKRTDVENALIIALLFPDTTIKKGHQSKAMFWAYELYCSGPTWQLAILLWRIYFDFYAVTYPFLDVHFTAWLGPTMQDAVTNLDTSPPLLSKIIRNLLYYRPSMDMFIAHNLLAENRLTRKVTGFIDLLTVNSLLSADNCQEAINVVDSDDDAPLLPACPDLINYMGARRVLFMALFRKYYSSLCDDDADSDTDDADGDIILNGLSMEQIQTLYGSPKCANPRDKLRLANLPNIGDNNASHLMSLNYFSERSLKYQYSHGRPSLWFLAYFTPYWWEKMDRYGAEQNIQTLDIDWPTEEHYEAFMMRYDYEIDEQPTEIRAALSLSPLAKPSTKKMRLTEFVETYYLHNNILPDAQQQLFRLINSR